jgi:hypothetical protein
MGGPLPLQDKPSQSCKEKSLKTWLGHHNRLLTKDELFSDHTFNLHVYAT